MYCNGQGVDPNYVESIKWYTLAAEQGNANAQFNLGYMYCNGQGVDPNYVESFKWYKFAAEQGNANAQYNLGVMYGNGHGVEQSYVEAFKLMVKVWIQTTLSRLSGINLQPNRAMLMHNTI